MATVLKEVIERIAERTFLPPQTIRMVIDSFVEVVIERLKERDPVRIHGFGRFKLTESIYKGKHVAYASFRSALAMRERLTKETVPMTMNKYAVVLDDNKSLQARLSGECPDCKSKLDSATPPHCPKCGSAPFEKPADDSSSPGKED
jgi:hypothetical protein